MASTEIAISVEGLTTEVLIDVVLGIIRGELSKACTKHPPMHSNHEGYAVILEELDELWDEVKRDNHDRALEEALQVGAMGVRFVVDGLMRGHR